MDDGLNALWIKLFLFSKTRASRGATPRQRVGTPWVRALEPAPVVR
jgi:hypothetical protein